MCWPPLGGEGSRNTKCNDTQAPGSRGWPLRLPPPHSGPRPSQRPTHACWGRQGTRAAAAPLARVLGPPWGTGGRSGKHTRGTSSLGASAAAAPHGAGAAMGRGDPSGHSTRGGTPLRGCDSRNALHARALGARPAMGRGPPWGAGSRSGQPRVRPQHPRSGSVMGRGRSQRPTRQPGSNLGSQTAGQQSRLLGSSQAAKIAGRQAAHPAQEAKMPASVATMQQVLRPSNQPCNVAWLAAWLRAYAPVRLRACCPPWWRPGCVACCLTTWLPRCLAARTPVRMWRLCTWLEAA